jgi:hypothetical protein
MASSMFSSDENIFWMGAGENMKENIRTPKPYMAL